MRGDLRNLIGQMASGDQQAFRKIFDLYSHKVYVFALKLTRSESTSEEIVQDVFIRIWMNRETSTRIDHFPSYLYTVTRNHTFNILKRLALEERAHMALATRQSGTHQETEEFVIYRDYQRILNQVIEGLPPQQRLVYGLCQGEGLKYEEAAQRLKISHFTVKTHMQQALRTIKANFARFIGFWAFLVPCII